MTPCWPPSALQGPDNAYDMETLLDAILERVEAIRPTQNSSLLLIDPVQGRLYFAMIVGLTPEKVKDVGLKAGKGCRRDHRFANG